MESDDMVRFVRLGRGREMAKIYEAPSIEVLGPIGELTLADQDGNSLDQDFPDNTPKGDLTFS